MESRNISSDPLDEDEKVADEKPEGRIFTGNSQINTVAEVNLETNERKEADVWKSDIQSLNDERTAKFCNILNIVKEGKAELREVDSSSNNDIAVALLDGGFSSDKSFDINPANSINLKSNLSSLLLKNIFSEKLNNLCNPTTVSQVPENTFATFYQPKKITHFDMLPSKENKILQIDDMVKQLFQNYRMYTNISAENPTTNFVCPNHEIDSKTLLRFISENHVENEPSSNKILFEETFFYDENEANVGSLSHNIAAYAKILDAMGVNKSYNWQDSMSLGQYFIKKCANNFETEMPLFVNDKYLLDDHMACYISNSSHCKTKYQDPTDVYFESFINESVPDIETHKSLFVKKKYLIDNRIPPDIYYPCYSQLKSEDIELDLQNFMGKSGFESQAALTALKLNNKSLIEDDIPLDQTEDYYKQNKYQNAQSQESLRPSLEHAKTCIYPSSMSMSWKYPSILPKPIKINTAPDLLNSKEKDNNILLCNGRYSEVVRCDIEYPLENQPNKSIASENISSTEKILHKKPYLIDQNFYKLRKDKEIADIEALTSKRSLPKKCCSATQKGEKSENVVLEEQIKKSNATDNFSPDTKLPYYSKKYYKLYYKHLIDQNFYKLRKEVQTANSTKNKPNYEKQRCNQVQKSINSDISNENDEINCGKHKTPDSNLLQYGFCIEIPNHIDHALPELSDSFDSSPTINLPSDPPDIFIINSNYSSISNKKLIEPIVAENPLQPSMNVDKDNEDGLVKITNSKTDVNIFCSNEVTQVEKQPDTPPSAASHYSLPNNLLSGKNAFNLTTEYLLQCREQKRQLFGELKRDNVKRIFDIYGPRYKSVDASNALIEYYQQNEDASIALQDRLKDERRSRKRKLCTDPIIDNVKRVCSILEPRFKCEFL